MTTTAQAPSEIWEADPAVMVPSAAKAGRSLARVCAVVSPRTPSSSLTITGSPRRCGISTGTISSSKTPFLTAAAASWWERADRESCSSRPMPSRVLCRSVDSPIAHWSNAQNRPSWAIESTTWEPPYFTPFRSPGSRWGALVMDSMPPATTMSNSPALMSWSARAMASRPDRHTLLMVTDGTVMGMPALTAAWREGICPAPAWRTWPMMTYSTDSGATPARSRAALMATPPSSTADSPDREPSSLPIGVRAPATMTELDMTTASCARASGL